VGYTVAGSGGKWWQTSTLTKTAGSRTSYPFHASLSKKLYFTHYNYNKITCWTMCYDEITGNWYRCVELHLKPGSYKAGATWQDTSHKPRTPRCTGPNGRNSSYALDDSRNWTFTNGVKVGSIIGVDLSASSGWTQRVSIEFRFRQPSGYRYVCGSRNPPTGDKPPGWVSIRSSRG
jgi:hypothetical protein